ncbi:MAG TPA: hypothetical protein VF306_16815 [Pirellulales bacterium]
MSINASSSIWDQFVGELVRGEENPLSLTILFDKNVDRVGMVREALRKAGGEDRAAALALLQRMDGEEQKQFFPELIQLARAAHGPVAVARQIIGSLPRQWVLQRIDTELEPILREEQYDDYWMFLELFADLDRDRAVRLARRAAKNADAEIRELGIESLANLGQSTAG